VSAVRGLACSFSEKDTEIKIKGELKSRPYIDITLEVLKEADAFNLSNIS